MAGENIPSVVRQALAEPEAVRTWALATAAAMLLVDDQLAAPILDRLTPAERVRLGIRVTAAVNTVLSAALAQGGRGDG